MGGEREREKSQVHELLSWAAGWTAEVDSMESALIPSRGPRRVDPEGSEGGHSYCPGTGAKPI